MSSDRHGIVLHCEPPWSKPTRVAVAFATAIASFAAVAMLPRRVFPVGFVFAMVVSIGPLLATQRVRLRARRVELRWLFVRRDVPYASIVGMALEAGAVVLRLEDGRRIALRPHVPPQSAPASQSARLEAESARDTLAYLLSAACGVVPDSGPITRVGDREVPAVTRAAEAPALDALLRRATRIARGRGLARVDGSCLVSAFVAGPEREVLVRCGLDPSRFGAPTAPAYREEGDRDLPLEDAAEAVLQGARFEAVQRGRAEITSNEVLFELFRTGDPATHPLVRAGLTPMRFVDGIAHGLSPSESDARAHGTLEPEALLAGIGAVDGDVVSLIVIDDDFTPTATLVELLLSHSFHDEHEAEAFARRVEDEGRAALGVFAALDGARSAIALMRAAREKGAPVLVRVEPASAD